MVRAGTLSMIALLAASILATTTFAANGYGTSTVTVANSSVTVAPGGTAYVSYAVDLASGNTWGTNFVIDNQAQLQSDGLTLSASTTQGDPTFMGTLTITAAPGSSGNYTAVLSATGDDPTTNNTTLQIRVGTPTIKSSSGTASPGSPTTVPATTVASGSSSSYNYTTTGMMDNLGASVWPYAILIIIILIGGMVAIAQKEAPSSRLVIGGVVLILIGVVVWLYGDYSGGNFVMIWAGVILILAGVAVWLVGDRKGHLI